jgi:hypothetical protein
MSASPTPVPPAHDEGAVEEASRAPHPWSNDDIVVVLFALFGLAGGAVLPLFLPVPPITTSFLLATGLAALTYRFLGGIQSSSVSIGVVRLTGSLAALVGVALVINHAMIAQGQQAYQVTGYVVDDTGKPAVLNASSFNVWPTNIYPDPAGNDFRITFTTGIDPNGHQQFPRLSISDGSLSDSIDLTPGAKNDVTMTFVGTVIKLGTIRLHKQNSSGSAQSLTPSPSAGETASVTTTPEKKP